VLDPRQPGARRDDVLVGRARAGEHHLRATVVEDEIPLRRTLGLVQGNERRLEPVRRVGGHRPLDAVVGHHRDDVPAADAEPV
jgi:hypothetical protein